MTTAEPESQLASSSAYSVDSTVSCRICKYNGGADLVTSPCLCKGSLGTVHVSCLEEWLTGSARVSCELCETPFNVVKTRKYTCLQSMLVFLRDYVNPVKLFRDVFFLTVSLMNTTVLSYLWFTYAFTESLSILDREKRADRERLVNERPFQALLYFCFFTTCLVFITANAVDDVRRTYYHYCRPWYRLWQTAVDVKLVVDEGTAVDRTKPKEQ